MTGRERCDEILRIIDQVLADADTSEGAAQRPRPHPTRTGPAPAPGTFGTGCS